MVGVLVVVVDFVHTTIVLLWNSISFHLYKVDFFKECWEEDDDDDDDGDDDDDTARVSIAATATTAVLVKSISPIE